MSNTKTPNSPSSTSLKVYSRQFHLHWKFSPPCKCLAEDSAWKNSPWCTFIWKDLRLVVFPTTPEIPPYMEIISWKFKYAENCPWKISLEHLHLRKVDRERRSKTKKRIFHRNSIGIMSNFPSDKLPRKVHTHKFPSTQKNITMETHPKHNPHRKISAYFPITNTIRKHWGNF